MERVHISALFTDAVMPGGTVMGLDVRADRVALVTALHAARVALVSE